MINQHQLDLDLPRREFFRPVHYLGSKLRLMNRILDIVDTIIPAGEPVVDLFSGSGTVSFGLSRQHPVIAVDIQEYSRVLAHAMLLSPRPTPAMAKAFLGDCLSSDVARHLATALAPLENYERVALDEAMTGSWLRLADLVSHGNLLSPDFPRASLCGELRAAAESANDMLRRVELDDPSCTLITRHYGGRYFAFNQARFLDSALTAAHRMAGEQREFWLAPVLSTASEIVNSIGKQFAQPITLYKRDGTPKPHLIPQIVRDRTLVCADVCQSWVERYASLPLTGFNHQALCCDYRVALAEHAATAKCVYADPPYTRDHYSRFYHVLETMCLRDTPGISQVSVNGMTAPSKGAYRKERHQSPFCIKSQAPAAFEALFDAVRSLDVPLVLSYSPFSIEKGQRPRVMSIEQLITLAKERFQSVKTEKAGRIGHNRLNEAALNVETSYDAELLLICKP